MKVTVGAFKTTATTYLDFEESRNYYVANIDAKLAKNINLNVSYLKDKDGFIYETTSTGLNYTGIKNITISGEYGQNDSTVARMPSNGKAKAWMGKIKYAGAKTDKVGSFGAWVGYRNADPYFDVCELTTLDSARQANRKGPGDRHFVPTINATFESWANWENILR
ncbi:hypothetical protein [Sporomusa silvacetica]|uniref:hypothetical protein n=1 Tax=Sporomusa silvacetica TaxID=55504 RepID=UPI0011818CDC